MTDFKRIIELRTGKTFGAVLETDTRIAALILQAAYKRRPLYRNTLDILPVFAENNLPLQT